MQDEVKALQLCQNKVRQKKLPMEVVDAEYQWWGFPRVALSNVLTLSTRDRRKLTFYFVADKRIDFRELVRELFRCALGPFFRCCMALLILCQGCIKRGSGWPRCRVPLAMNNDQVSPSSLPKSRNPKPSLHCFIFSPFLSSIRSYLFSSWCHNHSMYMSWR